MPRRWLVASVVAVLLVTAGVVGAVVLRNRTGGAGDAIGTIGVTSTTPSASRSVTASAETAIGAATTASSMPATTTSATSATSTTTTSAPAPAARDTSLSGRVKPGTTYNGVATFYDSDGGGACLYDPSPDPLTAAMNWADYEDAKACGAYVLVKAANGASITVRITNLCPRPCRVGQLDLSAEAFAMLAEPRLGEIPITWKLVSAPTPKRISIRYKVGSSQYWCGIQAIDHRNPVARLEVRTGAGWRRLPRAEYNYFISENGSGCGGAIAVTDIYGERLVVGPLPIKPDVTQATSAQFAGPR